MKLTRFVRNLHESAKQGFVYSPTNYDKGRPSYIPETISHLINTCNLKNKNKIKILEIGAGTGLFTKNMIDSLYEIKECEFEYTCMEPVSKMSDRIMEKIEKYTKETSNIKYELVETSIPNVKKIPLNHQFDAIFAAQSFHWFGSAESLKVLNMLLKHKGYLGIVGSIRDLTLDYNFQLEKLEKSYNTKNAPRFESLEWKKLFSNQTNFDLISEKQFPFTQYGDLEKMVNRFISISYVANFVSKSDENLELVSNKIKDIYLNNENLRNVSTYSVPHLQHVSIYQNSTTKI